MSKEIIIRVQNISKSFDIVGGKVSILKDISFEVEEGDFIVIYGPSGCGKSTLLHIILGLEKPNSGKVFVLGNDVYTSQTEDTFADFRKENIGMVYQQPNWVKAINVEENVALPLVLLGMDYESSLSKARFFLKSLNMLEWALYHPSELSSGQQQKVSLARAIITDPKIIITDEPTGNLDYESGEELIKNLLHLNMNKKKTVVMVTHDLKYLKYASRAIKLFDGEIQNISIPKVKK